MTPEKTGHTFRSAVSIPINRRVDLVRLSTGALVGFVVDVACMLSKGMVEVLVNSLAISGASR